MVSMTNARSQHVGKWAIILGGLVVLAAVAFAVRSNVQPPAAPTDTPPSSAAPEQ